MTQELVSLSHASQWASKYLERQVSPSNISYLVQYAKIKKYRDDKKVKVDLDELKKYYEHVKLKQESWKQKLGEDLNWGYVLNPYIGGDFTLNHDWKIDIKDR